MSFFEIFQKITPSWLNDGDGGKVLASLALIKDDFVARVKLGLLTRFPSYAVDDVALGAIGRDRKILRGINEPAASYSARLVPFLDDHIRRGNPFALLKQVQAYLQAPCVVRTVDRRGNWFTRDAAGNESTNINTGNWDWDGVPASPRWARFWLIIYPVGGTNPWAPQGSGGDPDETIGTTATADQIAGLRSIVREWKPAGTSCEWIIIAFDSASFSPSAPEPDGNWGAWSKVVGTQRVASRLSTARYFDGVRAP